MYAVFKEKQVKTKDVDDEVTRIIVPSETRFSGSFLMLRSLQKNKRALRETALEEDIGVPADFRLIVFDDVFWNLVSFILEYLEPIVTGTHVIEAHNAKLSTMVAVCMNVKHKLESAVQRANETDADGKRVCPVSESDLFLAARASRYRIQSFCITPLHLATYILDPEFTGNGCSDDEIVRGINVIRDLANFLKLDTNANLENLANFRAKSKFYGNAVIWDASRTVADSITWWNAF